MLKAIFVICFLHSFPLYAKKTVLVAFNSDGRLNITARLIKNGMKLADNNWPKKIQEKYQFIEVPIDGTLNGTRKRLTENIKKYKPELIFGAITSNQALLINIISEKYKIPFITPFATHPKVTQKNKYAFRTCFDDKLQAKKLAGFVYKSKKKRNGVILINRNQSYSIGMAKIFKKEFNKQKGTKISTFDFESMEDINSQLFSKISKLNPQFILLPSYQIESATIISKLLPKFPDAIYIGPDSWGGGRLFHSIIKELPFKFRGYYVQHYATKIKSKENKKFLKAAQIDPELSNFQSSAMLAPVAVGYDGKNFIYKLFENKSYSNVYNKIQNTKHEGVTGTINLKKSRTSNKELFIYAINNTSENFYESFK